MKVVHFYFLLAVVICSVHSNLVSYSRFRSKKRKKSTSSQHSWKRDFVIGIAVGYGLNTEASDEIKKCFQEKEKHHSKLIEHFFKNINSQRGVFKDQPKEKLEEGTKGFLSSARELFAEIRNCPPLRQSVMALIGNKILSLAVKGVIYVATGMTGLLIKTGYDIYKLASEIYSFYNSMQEKKKDYIKLGTSLGKILYYSQNILLRRRRRFRRK